MEKIITTLNCDKCEEGALFHGAGKVGLKNTERLIKLWLNNHSKNCPGKVTQVQTKKDE